MTNVIVTTTINPPTEAIQRFDNLAGWHLVVIGDRKTPAYHLDNGTYLGPAEQEALDQELSDLIGWNCIQRRNFGLLVAHRMGSEVVAVVDDDNIPYDHWGTDLMVGREAEVNLFTTDLPAFDPVGATNHSNLWHRGYPLQLLPRRDYSSSAPTRVHVDVQADFWDGDPDIDAICRMQFAPDCKFDTSCFPLASNTLSPFNSQNTFLSGHLLKDYFLFPHVGRMDDIWAAYHVQSRGARVVYAKPSVVQERNPHDLVVDMKREYLGYENNLALVEALDADPDALFAFLPPEAIEAFERYQRHFSS